MRTAATAAAFHSCAVYLEKTVFHTHASRLAPGLTAMALVLFAACGAPAPSVNPATSSPTATSTPSAPSTPPAATAATPSASPTPAPTPTPVPSPAPAALLLQVTNEGGFINPTAHLAELPAVTVDSDGHIYVPDTSATPGLVAPVLLRDVGTAGADQIVAALRAAGLDTAGHDCGIAADTGASVFTVELDGQEVVNRFAASGPGGPGGEPHPGAGASASAACDQVAAAAFDLLSRLSDPSETFGAPSAPTTAYQPSAYRVWVAQIDGAGQPAIDWPLSATLADFGTPATPDFGVTGLRSGIVLGADVQTLADTLAGGQPGDLFASNGLNYEFWVRALLPDELG